MPRSSMGEWCCFAGCWRCGHAVSRKRESSTFTCCEAVEESVLLAHCTAAHVSAPTLGTVGYPACRRGFLYRQSAPGSGNVHHVGPPIRTDARLPAVASTQRVRQGMRVRTPRPSRHPCRVAPGRLRRPNLPTAPASSALSECACDG